MFKTEDKTDANNYRPISLLSIFDRIFEKVMYKRMMSVLTLRISCFQLSMGLEKSFLLNMPL